MSLLARQVFVGDLSCFCTSDNLTGLFSEFGNVVNADIKTSKSGKPLSYGFITFEETTSVAQAIQSLDGVLFFGRKLRYVKLNHKFCSE
jgi:RNA recognition motif-containing protein